MQRNTLVAIAAALLVTASSAQNAGLCSHHLAATVLGKNSLPIPTLQADNFSVVVGKEPAKIADVRTRTPGRVIVLFDQTKGFSGGEVTLFEFKQSAAENFLNSLAEDSTVAVLGYSNTVQLISDFGSSPRAAASRIRELKPVAGRSGFQRALRIAIRNLSPAQPGDAIVLIASPYAGYPEENALNTPLRNDTRILSSNHVRVLVLLLQWFIPNRMEDYSGMKLVRVLGEETGGLVLTPDDSDVEHGKGAPVAAQLAAALSGSYDIEILLPNPSKSERQKVDLKLVNIQEGVKPKVVNYSKWLAGCPSTTSKTHDAPK